MSKTPGWSLDQPFDLETAAADLQAAAAEVARLSRTDDGTAGHANAIREAKGIIRMISARIQRDLRG
ncbi:hypothetical protein [Kitasatospora sp. NPDC058046]|uniref:hypothetical protein n=1 Tax=Kitasatospora sp. NPDC058046 TaxID=3346312 RepID=UPI0036DBC5AB